MFADIYLRESEQSGSLTFYCSFRKSLFRQ